MKINCFIFFQEKEQTKKTIETLKKESLVDKIFLLTNTDEKLIEGCEIIKIDYLTSSNTIKKIAEKSDTEYSLIYTKNTTLELGEYALDRFYQIAQDTKAGMIYSDYWEFLNGNLQQHPTIDYQIGSVRDDFDFGAVLIFNTVILKQITSSNFCDYKFAGLYDLRLKTSQIAPLIHINEYLYSNIETDQRKSGEKQFDYVDPKNRTVQIEMEMACTEHLKKIGAYLQPEFKKLDFNETTFKHEASVIIPVRNREKTIEDAILSVLKQQANFPFNLIVVDNFSTDRTSEIIKKYADKNENVIHVLPKNHNLGIGGCWNVGVNHPSCGKFSIQLDSDDIYENEHTLQTIVDAFYETNCGMVIGSYTMTNFNMQTIPPGLIDHKEWTPENGRNNALRINGLGAPRAFYTPLLRKIKVPNTSYGEDYALGLRISREYQIGRIYNSIYLCRRWNENSDASLNVFKTNEYNQYKDKIRSIEIMARIHLCNKC